MILKNGLILDEDFSFKKHDLIISNGKIGGSESSDDSQVLDLLGYMVIPGLIDIHIHGFNGYDSMDADVQAIKNMSISLAKSGTTSFLPTTMTAPLKKIQNAIDCISSAMGKTTGANILGVNMEGPFINEDFAGAQDKGSIVPPDLSFIKVNKEYVKLITVAPEVDGALDFIGEINKDIAVSIGHTASDYQTTVKAIEKGAKSATHLMNCMPPLHHREVGAVGAVLDKSIYAELICDGVHLSPPMIRFIVKQLDESRGILISDSLSLSNRTDGIYLADHSTVIVKNGRAYTKNGGLAGGTNCLLYCIKKAVEFGISLPQAVKMATLNPASLIGVDSNKGSIANGKDADLLVIDNNLDLKYVIINGKLIDI